MEPQDESSSEKAGRSDWQLLGQLELSTDLTAGMIHTWFMELLAPLHLHPDFVNQLLNSVQDAAMRTLHPGIGVSFEHPHLSVFVPIELVAQGGVWGFFRIEKIDSTELNKDQPNHAVEFYLYREGRSA